MTAASSGSSEPGAAQGTGTPRMEDVGAVHAVLARRAGLPTKK
jgi:hypothetical protein